MCTSIVEIVPVEGSGKARDGWFRASHAVVSYDHPVHAPLDDAIIVDVVNRGSGPAARACAELSLESARALHAALGRAIAAADAEEAERDAEMAAYRRRVGISGRVTRDAAE